MLLYNKPQFQVVDHFIAQLDELPIQPIMEPLKAIVCARPQIVHRTRTKKLYACKIIIIITSSTVMHFLSVD